MAGNTALPATFLDLLQRLHRECGFTTDREPASVKGQNNMAAKLVDWLQTAHQQVQGLQDRWMFDWATIGGALQANTEAYAGTATVIDPISGLPSTSGVKEFVRDRNAQYVYKPAIGLASRMFLTFVPWERFRGLNVPQINSSAPIYWTIRPDSNIVYFPAPNVTGWSAVHEVYLAPMTLVENTDQPRMPIENRMVIVWKAVLLFCGNRKDGNLYQHASNEFDIEYQKMMSKQLPQWGAGTALA